MTKGEGEKRGKRMKDSKKHNGSGTVKWYGIGEMGSVLDDHPVTVVLVVLDVSVLAVES
jgi:hypothetical protein